MDKEPRALLPAPSITERQQSIDQEAMTGGTGVDNNEGDVAAVDVSFELSSPSSWSDYSEDLQAGNQRAEDEGAEWMVLD